jgi:hypothetical protein
MPPTVFLFLKFLPLYLLVLAGVYVNGGVRVTALQLATLINRPDMEGSLYAGLWFMLGTAGAAILVGTLTEWKYGKRR